MTRAELLKIAKPILFNTEMVKAILEGRKTVTRRCMKNKEYFADSKQPCKSGDILYVRETWSEWTDGYVYKAWSEPFPQPGKASVMKWHPSLHMPKEAARIFLRVTDVRVERLKDMNLDDFLNEGITVRPEAYNDPDNAYWQAKNAFIYLWDSTIKKSDLALYGWEANPFVWVIEFERIEPDCEV